MVISTTPMRGFFLGSLFFAAYFFVPVAVFAAPSEIHIDANGKFSAKNVVVFQKIGVALFAKISWGKAGVTIRIVSDKDTSIVKTFGGASSIDDIQIGQALDIEGTLDDSSDTHFIVRATKIKNAALTEEKKTVSGTIKSIDTSRRIVVMHGRTQGTTTLAVPDGISIKKGSLSRNLNELKIGDIILSAPGTLDHATGFFTPTRLEVYQNKSIYAAKNYQGTLKSVSAVNLPATLVVTVAGSDYTVYVKEGAKVMRKDKSITTIKRFDIGDVVRFYGPRRESDTLIVDASVLRNLNL